MILFANIAVLVALLQAPPPPIAATFDGVFRSVESGRIVIEVQNGQSMRLFVTGSTKYIREGKPAKLSALHDGDPVSVDAERDARMNMVALRVEVAKPKPAGPSEKQ